MIPAFEERPAFIIDVADAAASRSASGAQLSTAHLSARARLQLPGERDRYPRDLSSRD